MIIALWVSVTILNMITLEKTSSIDVRVNVTQKPGECHFAGNVCVGKERKLNVQPSH